MNCWTFLSKALYGVKIFTSAFLIFMLKYRIYCSICNELTKTNE